MEIYLLQIAHGRSGDKGDTSNVCVFARKPEYYDGFNFVMHHALGGGATHSLRLDTLGKSMGSAFMRMKINVGEDELV